jgi:hypothetical protein
MIAMALSFMQSLYHSSLPLSFIPMKSATSREVRYLPTHEVPYHPKTTPLSIPYNLSILRNNMNPNCHPHQRQTTQAGEAGGEETGCNAFEEKCLLGGNALQIGRIYSNDSYLETAEESLCESTDPQQRREAV